MNDTPRSEQFDDVYFSAQDGLAETRHVFLAGNNLPAAWRGGGNFIISETGFGTGLNFLAVWLLFRQTAALGQKLTFISTEKYPLSAEKIRDYLFPWREDLKDVLELFLSYYPATPRGTVDMALSDQCRLLVYCEDTNTALLRMTQQSDCWFLDGFKPSANPDMWTKLIFENIARLTRPGGSFATFTAAGFVRRGLMEAGFSVQKVKGYGTKRDMLTGMRIT